MRYKLMTKFLGKIDELQKLIGDIGCDGEWEELPNQLYRFTSSEGAILNWYQTTKTVQFQGPKAPKSALEDQVVSAIAEWKPEPKSKTAKVSPSALPLKSNENIRVFVVHGHDLASRDQLSLILYELGLKPFVLANTGGDGLTLIEALEKEIGPGPGL